MMAVYIISVLMLGVWYFDLLTRYGRLWGAIPEEDFAGELYSTTASIVIPFRNEKHNLPSLIDSLNALSIGNHKVEVIFIDDHSTDGGVDIIEGLVNTKFTCKVIQIQGGFGKKEALKSAWKEAESNIILQTDADCILPENWLTSMLSHFSNEQVQLVSGPVVFRKTNTKWKDVVALDFSALIAIGAAHIEWGIPMICNGANLAYRRTVTDYAELGGNKSSGDDVFLMQSVFINDSKALIFNKSKDAMVLTNGPETFGEFWNQRLRWASKNNEYSIQKNIRILSTLWFYNVVILASVLSFTGVGALGAALLILLKVLAEDSFYSKFSDFFGLSSWFKTIVIGQLFHILYMAILPPLSLVLKYKWKDRRIN